MKRLLSLGETLGNSLPVNDLPDSLQVFGTSILVLKVVCVFPDINTEKWDEVKQGILVLSASDLEALGGLVIALFSIETLARGAAVFIF
jgi:hypothetical protein